MKYNVFQKQLNTDNKIKNSVMYLKLCIILLIVFGVLIIFTYNIIYKIEREIAELNYQNTVTQGKQPAEPSSIRHLKDFVSVNQGQVDTAPIDAPEDYNPFQDVNLDVDLISEEQINTLKYLNFFMDFLLIIIILLCIVLFTIILYNITKIFIKSKNTSVSQRIGFIIFIFSIIIYIFSILLWSQNSRKYISIFDMKYAHGIWFFIASFVFIVSLIFLTKIFDKIILWVRSGKK